METKKYILRFFACFLCIFTFAGFSYSQSLSFPSDTVYIYDIDDKISVIQIPIFYKDHRDVSGIAGNVIFRGSVVPDSSSFRFVSDSPISEQFVSTVKYIESENRLAFAIITNDTSRVFENESHFATLDFHFRNQPQQGYLVAELIDGESTHQKAKRESLATNSVLIEFKSGVFNSFQYGANPGKITIYPTFTKNKIFISIPEYHKQHHISHFQVLNESGIKVQEGGISGGLVEIALKCSPGAYIIAVFDKNMEMKAKGKVIVYQ